MNEIEIYKAYTQAKVDPEKTITAVAKKFKITRYGLVKMIRRIEQGNVIKIKQCNEYSRIYCLWLYKYKPRYEVMPKNRVPNTVKLLRALIKEMRQDGFSHAKIGACLGKTRNTIIYHLNS